VALDPFTETVIPGGIVDSAGPGNGDPIVDALLLAGTTVPLIVTLVPPEGDVGLLHAASPPAQKIRIAREAAYSRRMGQPPISRTRMPIQEQRLFQQLARKGGRFGAAVWKSGAISFK
jgi:hypothetical protein